MAAFFWALTYALYRVMRVYNRDNAFQYKERIKEYAEDDQENQEQYEFPEVEKALPECIRLTLKSGYSSRSRYARRLLSAHRRGKYRHWIERLRKIERLRTAIGEGMTVFLYDPQAGQWSMNFANSSVGKFTTPMIGSFQNGRAS